MPKITEMERWQTEIQLAEQFQEDEFGTFTKDRIFKAGENIDYFEKGLSTGFSEDSDDINDSTTTLNLVHAIAKNIVPALYYQNPKILSFPKRSIDEEAAPFAAEILNHYYKEIEAEKHNRNIIWDAYVLGLGIYKVGYTTKFGVDIKDEKTKKKSRLDRIKEQIGLKKKEETVPVRPEIDKEIIAESPYIQWISPFNFLIDPRATNIDNAMWVAHVVDKTIDELKSNPMFKNTSMLKPSGIEDPPQQSHVDIPPSQIEKFQTVKLYEIHYRTEDGFYLLYIVKNGTVFNSLYHEKSIYDMDEWQFGVLNFSEHRHKFYTRSEITKIKSLQDRFTSTFDSILEQIDSFVPKIGIDETSITTDGKKALEDGDIGSIVYFNKNPREGYAEIGLTQFKSDLRAFEEQIINLVTIQTGLSKAQLTGVATGETATAETIARGGQTLRIQDMTSDISRFSNKQCTKLWKIIRQFVDLPTLELITGESGVDPQTGLVRYTWLPEINPDIDIRLQEGNFRFDTEVGSTQKADSALIIKRIENILNILARTDVIALMQQQGKKVDLAEILRMMLRQMPEVIKDLGKIIQDVGPETQGMIPPELAQQILGGGGPGGPTAGSQQNAMAAQRAQPAATQPVVQSEGAQL